MSRISRNDPCPCGSGKKSKRCCGDSVREGPTAHVPDGARLAAIEAAKTPAGMAAEREQYARTWSEGDAAAFEKGGHYVWMAARVSGYRRVLELGTGDGRGTVALLRAGHEVVSIDENPECLRRATDNITAAGLFAATDLRGAVSPDADGYRVTYRPVTHPQTSGAVLIEGDTLNDAELLSWLASQPRFDAVVCWLVGSHRARQLNVALPREDAGSYRLRVQNALYELADELLRPGGVLNIIDREMIGTTPSATALIRLDRLRAHRAQAQPTTLTVGAEVLTRPYALPAGVEMQVSLGLSGLVPADVQPGLTSVIAKKG